MALRMSWNLAALVRVAAALSLLVSSWLVAEERLTEQPATSATPLVRYGKERLSLEAIVAKYSENNRLEKYRELQAKVKDTEQDHIQLADWCKQYHLLEQERAHLLRSLDFNPDNEAVRKRVGYIRGEREWLTKEATIEKERREGEQAAATKKWTPRIEDWQRLTQTSAASREKALAQLRAVTDPLAIPALEAVLAKDSANGTVLAEILGRFETPAATAALVRLAVDSEFQHARAAAIEQLKKQDHYAYVPLLLSGLRGPVSSTNEVVPTGPNLFELRQSVRCAAEDHDEIIDHTKTVRYRGKSEPTILMNDVRQRAVQENRQLLAAVASENTRIATRNARIVAALEATTGHKSPDFEKLIPAAFPNANANQPAQLPAVPNNARVRSPFATAVPAATFSAELPTHWWSWWKQENEVTEQRKRGEYREQRTSFVSQDVPLQPGDYQIPTGQSDLPSRLQSRSSFQSRRDRNRHECFVAGTTVWSLHGMLPIETMQTGDLVLTKNVRTGELEFKAVVRPTMRPQMQLVRLAIGEETFTCTPGHVFMLQNGTWKKARDLEPGMQVQSANGILEVFSNIEGPQERTYNLVVDENHNYFVGSERLLSHDNTDVAVSSKTIKKD